MRIPRCTWFSWRAYLLKTAIVLTATMTAFTTTAFSGSPNKPLVAHNAFSDKAHQARLWEHPEWLNLLHYKVSQGILSGAKIKYESFVDDDAFFLANTGDTDPQAEMLATIEGLFDTRNTGNEHAQCRFPARRTWLEQQLAIQGLPSVRCPLYDEWRGMIHAGSVVLVFPAHHLNSPSSMFGHTLLRLDSKPDREHTDWLAFGVNFGANVPAGDNSILYAYRGLTGGYPGQFIVEPYFKKIQEYNRDENRDIWEYPLNLTQEETTRLVTHLWELKDINFDYFFFTENCSYRLLELLEVARPGTELTDEFVISAIPIDTVRAVERGGFISSTRYRPAMATRLKHQLAALPDDLRPLLIQLAEAPHTTAKELNQLPPETRYYALETSYTGLRYQQAKRTRDKNAAQHSHAILNKLSEQAIQPEVPIPSPTAPQSGHESKRITTRIGRDDDRNYTELELRMAYHSLLDNQYGFLSGAQINMGNTSLRRYDDGSVKLERLDAADIFSLTPRDTFFNQLSWRVYGGLERINTDKGRPLAVHVTGGGGYAYTAGSGTVFALLSGRVEHNRDMDETAEIAIGPQLGWLYQTPFGAGMVNASGLQFSGGEQRLDFGIEQNIVLSLNHALRVSLDHRRHEYGGDATEFSLGYHWYFR